MALVTGRDFKWMAKHCRSGHEKREIAAPFCLKGGTVDYAVASQGHYMIAVTLHSNEEPPFDFSKVDDCVLKFLETGDKQHWVISPKELLDWIKCKHCNNVDIVRTCPKCSGRKTQPCSECGGNGTVSCTCECGHKHLKQCYECEGKKTEDCSQCDGRGTVSCCCREDADPGSINHGVSIDRRFIRRAFADMPIVWGKMIHVSVNGYDRVVRFDFDGWSLVIMPTNAASNGNLDLEKVEPLDAMAQI